jgi:hypothetical protein
MDTVVVVLVESSQTIVSFFPLALIQLQLAVALLTQLLKALILQLVQFLLLLVAAPEALQSPQTLKALE